MTIMKHRSHGNRCGITAPKAMLIFLLCQLLVLLSISDAFATLTVTQIRQYRADTGAQIPAGGAIPAGVGVYFDCLPVDTSGATIKMDVELRQLPGTFTGSPNYTSPYVASGTRARTTTATGLASGNYGWTARVVNSSGIIGNWVAAGNPDFIVQGATTVTLTLSVRDGSVSGPTLAGVLVTGTDGGGNSFSQTTGAGGYVTITGIPGTWFFTATTVGYNANNWSSTVTYTKPLTAYLTAATVNYTIAVSASPSAGGSVGGSGMYTSGSLRTVTATANSGYTFANWTEGGSVVSSSSSYTFTLSGSRTLVANFTANTVNYTIAVSASPSAGGSVGGSGTYASGSLRTVTATANSGYTFANWTEGGSVVSSSSSYTFTLSGSRTLVANFASTGSNMPGVSAGHPLSIDASPPAYCGLNPFFNAGHGGQCTSFCWGRAREKLGISLPFLGNALTWWNSAQGVYQTGSEAQPNSIAVWSYNGYGHVAFVEAVVGDQVTLTEANVSTYVNTDWGGGYDGIPKTRSKADWTARNLGTAGLTQLMGYIYLDSATTLPPPVLSNPVNGSTGQSKTPTFAWSAVTGANSGYRIMVATSASDLPTDPTASTGGSGVIINATPSTTSYTPATPLNPGTTYYWEVHGRSSTLYGTWSGKNSFTTATATYTIAVSASPIAGGLSSGGGTFASGSSRTVTATANSGYRFANWTENGSQVSTSSSYTFTLNGNRTLIANFTANGVNYTIGLSVSPSAGGSVGGSGTYASGSLRTVTATANSGYTFANWTEGGSVVSRSSSYTFTLSGSRTLVANFRANTQPLGVDVSYWNGTVNWSQVVNPGGKAFAIIRATAGINTTDSKFAQNAANAHAAGVIVGTYHFAYPEYFTAQAEAQKFLSVAAAYIGSGYLPPALDIETSDVPADDSQPSRMGKAALSQWIREWCAAVKTATGVTPMIYTTRWYAKNYFDSDLSQYPYWVPTYSSADTPPNSTPTGLNPWSTWTFQQYAVDPTTQGGGVGGTCPGITGNALLDSFNGSLSGLQALANQTASFTITVSASPNAGGSVGGSGTYASGSLRTVTATANSGYTFANWTEGGTVVSSSSSYMFTLSGNRALVANFVASTSGVIKFAIANSSVSEAAGTVTLQVIRIGGSSGAASVKYITASKTAVSGQDYFEKSGALTWIAGSAATKTIVITIVNDSITEPSEFFKVKLFGATGALLGAPNVATVTIPANVKGIGNQSGVVGSFVPIAVAVDNEVLSWKTKRTVPWTGQTMISADGEDALRSGTGSSNGVSWLETVVTGPGTLGFDWRLVTANPGDTLLVLDNGTVLSKIAGLTDWAQSSFPLSGGAHTVRWVFVGELNGDEKIGAGYLDRVKWKAGK